MRKLNTFAIICLTAWVLVNNPWSTKYLAGIKNEAAVVSVHEDNLMREIEMKAAEYEVPASNAKIDRVWKAMPGYNGLKIDIKQSYKKMKQTGKFSEEKLIFKQTVPEVLLRDLPPEAVYRGHPDKPMASFIINVAWGNEYLSGMLATLKKHHVSASFFLEGNWVKKNPDLAKMIVDAGHEIGNHSYSHPDMKQLSPAEINEQIVKTNAVISATTGVTCRWFAPPSGSYKDEVVKIAAAHKLGTVMWSIDTIDWQKPAPEKLIERVTSRIHNGALILMHPTESTANSLDQLIRNIKSKNIELGTVSENLSEERILTKK
ncbi:polysaccharide deacetylase family protein [Bacillus sp. T33-2]|uniref:polysaccharide deacetylase family protein n=1 Tax=Bacillus sp. T33-2 TaxID=2054168 RepID=UPI000C773954|nr:polysaccharide deacetylase family protein [Bacillus sp. T33-2]PLR97231.1 hypothetical protein CVD19_06990 [Bacillus sp. T33-2]